MESEISDPIMKKIVKLKTGFIPELDIKKLRGYPNHYRLRVGGYRVLFQLRRTMLLLFMLFYLVKKHINIYNTHQFN